MVSFDIFASLVGALAALLAVLPGIGGAWCFVLLVLGSSFSADPVVLALVVLTTLLLTIGAGVALTWSALSTRPGSFLRSA